MNYWREGGSPECHHTHLSTRTEDHNLFFKSITIKSSSSHSNQILFCTTLLFSLSLHRLPFMQSLFHASEKNSNVSTEFLHTSIVSDTIKSTIIIVPCPIYYSYYVWVAKMHWPIFSGWVKSQNYTEYNRDRTSVVKCFTLCIWRILIWNHAKCPWPSISLGILIRTCQILMHINKSMSETFLPSSFAKQLAKLSHFVQRVTLWMTVANRSLKRER